VVDVVQEPMMILSADCREYKNDFSTPFKVVASTIGLPQRALGLKKKIFELFAIKSRNCSSIESFRSDPHSIMFHPTTTDDIIANDSSFLELLSRWMLQPSERDSLEWREITSGSHFSCVEKNSTSCCSCTVSAKLVAFLRDFLLVVGVPYVVFALNRLLSC
jgi:hypothetical protein